MLQSSPSNMIMNRRVYKSITGSLDLFCGQYYFVVRVTEIFAEIKFFSKGSKSYCLESSFGAQRNTTISFSPGPRFIKLLRRTKFVNAMRGHNAANFARQIHAVNGFVKLVAGQVYGCLCCTSILYRSCQQHLNTIDTMSC